MLEQVGPVTTRCGAPPCVNRYNERGTHKGVVLGALVTFMNRDHAPVF
jgi:hypothetical protein